MEYCQTFRGTEVVEKGYVGQVMLFSFNKKMKSIAVSVIEGEEVGKKAYVERAH